jgi:hypothetical protein
MSKPRMEDKVNNQFYRRLKLDKDTMEIIKYFRKLKKFMLGRSEGKRRK